MGDAMTPGTFTLPNGMTIVQRFGAMPVVPRSRVPAAPVMGALPRPAIVPAARPRKIYARPIGPPRARAAAPPCILYRGPIGPGLDGDPMRALPSPGFIIDATSRHMHIPTSAMLGRHRSREVALARHIAMWLVRHHTPLGFPAIASRFEHRHHTTVMSAVCKVDALLAGDDTISRMVRRVIETVGREVET